MTTEYRLTTKQIDRAIDAMALHLYDYCKASGIHDLIIPESGGLDSAVTTGAAAYARDMAKMDGYRLDVTAVMIPIESSPDAERLALDVINQFGVHQIKVEWTEVFRIANGSYDWRALLEHYVEESRFEHLLNDLPRSPVASINEQVKEILVKTQNQAALDQWDWSRKVAQGNIKARLRMITAYHIARLMKGLVLSTDNLSEFWMAFWTICGDVGDFGMIQNVLKGKEMKAFARRLCVPEEVINRKPDADLGISKNDEDELRANYDVIDEVMIKLIQVGFDPDGDKNQLNDLPIIDDYPYELIHSLAERALNGAFKRRGTLNLGREDLGLPHIEDIVL
ncbi:NAD(+) synthase [Candidatus Falkowbacteria bacterium]|nr:NAD(+) synthase [Candidatus Falkowbacteria bacterium]MBT6574422.1 NAD(+) synthase [Candidatus Falkowbacteria bacterium]MBT7348968.1 NAD(+) synthase [Candidatus Falkowbacteria bacterium]MBT7500305.1 NAD(+) synthase [Candidatus Falkowbacteria bacterium]